jgi:hypothetical protein
MDPCTAQSSCMLVEYYYYMTEITISYHKSYSLHLHDWKKAQKSLIFNSKYNSKLASSQSFVISRTMAVPCLPYPILQFTMAFTRSPHIPGGWSPWRLTVGRAEYRWNDTDRGKTKYRRKTCPSATLSITEPTRTDLKTNPGLRGKIPATNPPKPWHGFEKEN